jgi:TIR domain
MTKKTSKSPVKFECSLRFESVRLDSLFDVLDAIAWLTMPDVKQISQFADIDPRTAGKLLKNGVQTGLIDAFDSSTYSLRLPYPFKGTTSQKRDVVREALIRMPLLQGVRQFLALRESLDNALRKAATVQRIENYDSKSLAPLMQWAQELKALEPGVVVEDLLKDAQASKELRHKKHGSQRVAFLSHSSQDKTIIRQIASDLTAEGVEVWLDEQRIHVGDSIPEKIAQGLAQSDFFLIALSEHSVDSEWVKRELNNALVQEISKRKIAILPLKLSACEIPMLIAEKKYADFSRSYREGIDGLIASIKAKLNNS